jgi:hypothetical protein
MTAARMIRRAMRLEAQAEARTTERRLRCLAAELGIASETLRTEAIDLLERFGEAGVATLNGKVAFVADELAMPIEDLRRAVDQTVACCQ